MNFNVNEINGFIELLETGRVLETTILSDRCQAQFACFDPSKIKSNDDMMLSETTTTLTPGKPLTPGPKQTERSISKQREVLLPTASIHRSISTTARKTKAFETIGGLAEDREFLKYLGDMESISNVTGKAIAYIDQRENFWRN